MRMQDMPQTVATSSEHVPETSLWQREKRSPFRGESRAAVRLARMRLSRSRGLLAMVGFGMLIAAVLLCTVPLFTTLMGNFALQQQLRAGGNGVQNVEVQLQTFTPSATSSASPGSVTTASSGGSANPTSTTYYDSTIQSIATRNLHAFVAPAPNIYLQSDQTVLVQAGTHSYNPNDPLNTPVAKLYTFDYASAARHIQLVQGALPTANAPVPEMLITQEMAQREHLQLGSLLRVEQNGDAAHQVVLRVVGIMRVPDATDPYWNNLSFAANVQGLPHAEATPPLYPLLVARSDFFRSVSHFVNFAVTDHWVYSLDFSRLTTSNIADAATAVTQFTSQVNVAAQKAGMSGVAVYSNLSAATQRVQQQQQLLGLPVAILVTQIVGLVLLFVATMASLLIEAQRLEITTLQSRGLSTRQLVIAFSSQGLLLGVVVLVLGPVLAVLLNLGVAQVLFSSFSLPAARTATPNLATLLRVLLTTAPGALLLAALLGTALGVLVVAASALQAGRQDVLAFRREQARGARPPIWQRLHLDVLLAILCLVGYLDLGQFGSTSTRLALGSASPSGSTSPLLLIAPSLLLLAGALLLLRLLPLVARWCARWAARRPGAPLLLATAQLARTPGRASRRILFLVLAVGLGLFALTFNASLARNVQARVAYEAGADVRLSMGTSLTVTRANGFTQTLQQLPEVESISAVARTTAMTTYDQGSQPLSLLAIDSRTFGRVAGTTSWRAGYANAPLQTLLARLQQPTTDTGQPLPALVSSSFAAQYGLTVGKSFVLTSSVADSGTISFRVAGIVRDFPTLYPAADQLGFLVVDLPAFSSRVAALGNSSEPLLVNELWLRTSGTATDQATLLKALHGDIGSPLNIQNITTRSALLAAAQADPTGEGIRGLLLIGAGTALLLAIVGSLVQALLATRQRRTQFAILRTLGMSSGELRQLLVSEQVVIDMFGLVGGTLLGLVMTTATLPYLQFSEATVDPTHVGIPPYALVFAPRPLAAFYVALAAALVLSLGLAARYASHLGLGKALRIGED